MLKFRKYWVPFLILLYILLNLATLTKFPLMHSDESWLSGLSRHMWVAGDYSVTEPFFDLKPRNQHALKIIFHSMQILMIKAFGFNLFNIRFLSLVFGLATLFFFYRLCLLVFPDKIWARRTCLLMGIDIQFIYASHFGRQEIILLWLMVFGMYYYFRNFNRHLYRHDLILGALAGLSLGIHPNGLIFMLILCSIYLTHIVEKKIMFRSLLVWGLSATCFIFIFIILSYRFDPNFLTNYFNYGEEQFKVLHPFIAKLSRLAGFARNILLRQGGTYYLPDLKAQILLLSAFILLGMTITWRSQGAVLKWIPYWLTASVMSIIVGLVSIGRYNTTNIVFLVPFVYLLTGFSLARIPEKPSRFIFPFLALALFLITAFNIYPFLKYDYPSYLRKVATVVSPDRKVLASLNLEYGFNDGKLFDLRNLSFLKKEGITFAEYLRKNQIEYIIYPEGLDFIYRNRPKWNGVYGHLPYYRELRQFLRKQCQLVSTFEEPAYGIEIPAYVGLKKWQIFIYRVLP